MGDGGTQDYTQAERNARWRQRHLTEYHIKLKLKRHLKAYEKKISLAILLEDTESTLTNLFSSVASSTTLTDDPASQE